MGASLLLSLVLLLWLLWLLVGTGLWRRYRLFSLYCSGSLVRLLQGFTSLPDGSYMASEGALMSLKALAVAEGAVFIVPRPAVRTLSLGVALASILAGIATLLPAEPNPVREFERWRQVAHVWLAGFAWAVAIRLWLGGWRGVSPYVSQYWRIWTFRLTCMAGLGFLNYPAAASDARKWELYCLLADGYLVSAWVAMMLWIKWAARSRCGP